PSIPHPRAQSHERNNPIRTAEGYFTARMPEHATTDIERIRASIEAAPDVDAVLSFFAPDALWESEDLGVRVAAAAAIRDFLADWYGTCAETTMKAENLQDHGNDVFYAEVVQEGRLADSAGSVRQRSGSVVVMRDGMIVHVVICSAVED